MPTLNPRVNVTLSPSLDSLVSRLADLERVSKSMVLRELLEAAEPSLLQAVALMEAAKGASVNARERMAASMQKTIEDVNVLRDLSLEIAATRTRDIVAEAEAIRGRRPSRLARVSASSGAVPVAVKRQKTAKRPPLSNRGVKK